VTLWTGRSGPVRASWPGRDGRTLSATGSLPGVTVRLSDASLVWFAGSDGGTVPAQPDEAYLQVLSDGHATRVVVLPASDFTSNYRRGGGPGAGAADATGGDRRRVPRPASFSVGTVVVSSGGRSSACP